jgi:Kef-type K+ transport system membrane component KefB
VTPGILPLAAGVPEAFVSALLFLAVVLAVAKLGGDLASRIGQPAVLGELVAGVVIGNLGLIGFHGFDPIHGDPTLATLAELGVLLLLFEVGLESTVGQMLKVGVSSLFVATLGVVAPFGLGWLVGVWLLPEDETHLHAFLGATLCATSVGITARVLQDLNRSKTPEARVILGAAVLDDVMGLVILAVVSGAVAAAEVGGTLSAAQVGGVLGKAVFFLVGALAAGWWVSPRLFRLASRLRARGVLLAGGLAFCFLVSYLSGVVGLAPIVGAFAAGLILEDLHFRDFLDRGEHSLAELIHPIAGFLVPVFFVRMGALTDLRSFVEPGVAGLAVALTVAAILGKQACSLGVVGRGYDRLSIGIGMIPRGEVGLIFAAIGTTLTFHGHPVIPPTTYAALVVMVIFTTMATPPALKWSLSRKRAEPAGADESSRGQEGSLPP